MALRSLLAGLVVAASWGGADDSIPDYCSGLGKAGTSVSRARKLYARGRESRLAVYIEAALLCLNHALELGPSGGKGEAGAQFYRGASLALLQRHDEALLAYERSRALDPTVSRGVLPFEKARDC